MSYVPSRCIAELNGSASDRVLAGSNGAGSVKGPLNILNNVPWLTVSANKEDFDSSKETVVFGWSHGTNSTSSDFYHLYKIVGSGHTSFAAQTNGEAARNYSKLDEDSLAIGTGAFSMQCVGKYSGGYFVDAGSKVIVIRLEF